MIGLTSSGFAPAAVQAKSRLSQDISKLRGQTPALKPVATQHDASKPVLEPTVHLKKVRESLADVLMLLCRMCARISWCR